MILTDERILESLKCEDKLKELKEEHSKLVMHVHGIGVTEYLNKIEGLENETQISLRKKLTKSNKNIISDILRPVDKIFKAQGGSKEYLLDNSKKEAFEDKLSVIYNDQSFFKWLKTYFLDKYVIDPNGVYLFEHDEGEAYPTYKSILTIREYQQNGLSLEFIIFEPVEVEENNKKIKKVRVYDDEGDKMYKLENDKITLIEDETFDNPWAYVPAVLCSDVVNPLTDYKESFLYAQIDMLDEYLRENSVKTLAKYHHGFPLYWEYMSLCPVCKGEQYIKIKEKTEKCYSCAGTGYATKKDVSDIKRIKPPDTNESPTIAPDVAGYIVPPIDSLEFMNDDLKLLRDMTYYSLWGVLLNRDDTEKTAFEVAINTQPMQDKLNDVTNSLDVIETALIDILGDYYYKGQYKGSSINNGRYYMIMSPNDIMKIYLEHKEKNASQTILNNELRDYYNALYQYDPHKRAAYIKLIQVEPFVHYTINEAKEFAPIEELNKKIYYSQWITTKDLEYFSTKSVEALQNDLSQYVTQKLKENETKNLQRVQGEIPGQGDGGENANKT